MASVVALEQVAGNSTDSMTESELHQLDNRCWLSGWFHWIPTSMAALKEAESRILSHLKTSFRSRYVTLCSEDKKGPNKIWTISMNENLPNTPLVLVHGFASGVALWALNLDPLASRRPVYAFDVLGFGRSSRPAFSSDPIEAENQLVESIEEWRQAIDLQRFILLGHSMGGFLAAAYAIRHPERVEHLILADPWGFQEKPSDGGPIRIPLWAKAIITLLQPFNPLAGLRAAGPLGPKLIDKVRPDLKRKFSTVIEDVDAIPNYIYHCNAQIPSGETAFKALTESIGWAKNPMVSRMTQLREGMPVTFLYGERSWIDKSAGYQTQRNRKGAEVQIRIIKGAGHHVYADQADDFNQLVGEICDGVDDRVNNDAESAATVRENLNDSGFRSLVTSNRSSSTASSLDD